MKRCWVLGVGLLLILVAALMKPMADRLLDMAVRQDSPSEPLMGSLLFCLVILPKDVELTRRVQAIETHIARLFDEGELPGSKPSETGTGGGYRYGDASKRYWAACALLKYGTSPQTSEGK